MVGSTGADGKMNATPIFFQIKFGLPIRKTTYASDRWCIASDQIIGVELLGYFFLLVKTFVRL